MAKKNRTLRDRLNELNAIIFQIEGMEESGVHWNRPADLAYGRYVLWTGWWPSFSTRSFREAKAKALRMRDYVYADRVETA